MLYLKYFIFFLISFLIFCIPISDRPLFNHAYDTLSPITKKLFAYIKKEGVQKLEEGKKVGAKYIIDSVPEKIKKVEIPQSEEPLSIEEKEFLEQIL